jgi:glycosyltransferase involved in cell wall biosynthesis
MSWPRAAARYSVFPISDQTLPMEAYLDKIKNCEAFGLDAGSGPTTAYSLERYPGCDSVQRDVVIVIPAFDDWISLAQLLEEIDRITPLSSRVVRALIVDDASTEECPRILADRRFAHIASVDIVRLSGNLGHQRAIAIGLVEAARMPNVGAVLVMDGDGEDRPADLLRLLEQKESRPGAVICAQRLRRSEGWAFRFFYGLYKIIFYLFTGARIDFGNYCLIPRRSLETLIHNPAIWNNLAAAICRSRLPLVRVPTARGTRYEGKSHMNFVALLLHGFTAISVYSDLVMVRIVLCTAVLCTISFAALVVVIALKLFTNLAIPGWTSQVGGLLVIMILQSLLIAAVAAFQIIGGRSTKPMIPAVDAASLVSSKRRSVAAPVTPGTN